MVPISHTTNTRFLMAILCCLFIVLPVAAQEESEAADDDKSVAKLVKELRDLSVMRIDMKSDKIVDRQRRKVELANRILDHEDASDIDFNYATVARLQSLGIHFAFNFQNKRLDEDLKKQYADAIEEALESEERNIVFEATTASAGFRAGLYTMEPNEEHAELAATAIARLNEAAPKDPLVQATRRLLLEQIRNADKPRMMFEQMKTDDEKLANIVLNNLDGKTEKDETDFLWARHFAKLGDFVAQRRLALMYETGKGTRVNFSQASRWYKKLARLNDTVAITKLGDFYLEGKGYFKNPEQAVKNYQQAAKANSRVAQFKLGECYRTGTGVEQSDENWMKWVQTSASSASGVEVQQVYSTIEFDDAPDSYRVFYEALIDEHPEDIYFMNNLAYSLLIGSDKDAKRALELIETAIEDAGEDFAGLDSFRDTKATALKQLGKWKAAAEIFESILPNVDDKEPVLKSLIECFGELDDDEKTKAFQEQLDKLMSESDSSKEDESEDDDA